jgi:DNA-binding transcriptional LysR family regulator
MAGARPFPTAHQLALIAAVAEHGGVTAAAAAMSISQPAVTAQLRAAEDALGQRLFLRTRAGLVPTAAGRAVAAFARRQESLRRSLVTTMTELAEGKGGALVVGAGSTPGEYWLPQWLSAFRRALPNVEVSVVLGTSREALARLENGAVDLAVVGVRQRARGLKFFEIGIDRIVAVAGRGSRWTKGYVSPRAMADASFIVREEGSATRDCGLACLKRIGVNPKRLMPLATDEAIVRMAAADLGIGILSARASERHVDEGSIAYVRIHGWKCRRRLYVVRRSDVRNSLVDALWNIATKRAPRAT